MTMKVRDILRRLKGDGWILVRTVGSHHQFVHPTKPGTVTKARTSSGRHWTRFQTGRLEMTYLAILETDGAAWNAYVPDLPGCIAVGDTRDEVASLISEAVPLHVKSLRERGESVPQPSAIAALDIDAA